MTPLEEQLEWRKMHGEPPVQESTEVFSHEAHRRLRGKHLPIVNVKDEVRELRTDMGEWNASIGQ